MRLPVPKRRPPSAALRHVGWAVSISLCLLCVLCVSVVTAAFGMFTTETQRSHREAANAFYVQGPELDYSKFLHTSQRHASLACASCHQRGSDNSATPKFPGHKACNSCHLGQLVTPAAPMCLICHTDVNGQNPPLKSFSNKFKESFNAKFDHAQHMTGSARPQSGCSACHTRANRGVALSIPVSLGAHNQCYSCHTPDSRSQSGKEIASCGVCHDARGYRRTPTTARAYRLSFSHADHAARERLTCTECHRLTAGAPQSHQVSFPSPAEHLNLGTGMSCFICHNGKRSFGGDLAFKDCGRCHSGATFRMPM
jgi:c(7)-type cytochrome triheme protein